jgi:anti-sigma regulatory factor (Ser/Thr protein kinase)
VDTGSGKEPVTLVRKGFTVRNLYRLRQLVRWAARRVGLDSDRTGYLVIAVSEAAGNAIAHGGGHGALEVIQDDQRRLIAEVSDHGPGLPPNIPVTLPDPDAISGRGLWLIHEACDRVDVTTGSGGTTVRMEMTLTPQPTAAPPQAPAELPADSGVDEQDQVA